MTIFEKVAALNLPVGHYVVIGGGPLAAHTIRESHDIDLLVTAVLYEKLKAAGWKEEDWPEGGHYACYENIEADTEWSYGSYNPRPEELIKNAEIINGIPFAPLQEVLQWKRAFGRPKDLADIKLIEAYLLRSN